MRVASRRRWFWLVSLIGLVLALLVASIPFAAPTIAAAACPGCYGMQPLGENLFVNVEMPENIRSDLRKTMLAAEMPVAAFFGSVSPRRIILVCGAEECETRLKGWLEGSARVRAFTYDAGGYPVLRFSPRGLSTTVIAHELTHLELHERIGFFNHMRGIFPAWFDEGLAVLISDDRRYFRAGKTAAERCLSTPNAKLPSEPLAWDDMVGKSPWIYPKNGRWMLSR